MNWLPKEPAVLKEGQTREREIFCWLPHYGVDGKMHWLERATVKYVLRITRSRYGYKCAWWHEVTAPSSMQIVPNDPPPPPRKS